MNTNKKCSCAYCETELTNSCMSPQFCKPCQIGDSETKVCKKCGAVYAAKYTECPSCLE